MIHLMELPNPDPLTGRPEHGGRDRHACIAIRDVSKLKGILDNAGKFFLHFLVELPFHSVGRIVLAHIVIQFPLYHSYVPNLSS